MPYVSYRGTPLLAQEPDQYNRPIVTMENYCKWYSVEILHPDGKVESADVGKLEEIQERLGMCLIIDHCYHPRLLNELAKEIGGLADDLAIEMTTGRWVLECMNGKLGNINVDAED